MPAPAWEDLGAFFNAEEFATEAVFALQAGARRVVGHFDDPTEVAGLGGYREDQPMPTLTAPMQALQGIPRGTAVTIHGRTYETTRLPHDDGTGVGIMTLALA